MPDSTSRSFSVASLPRLAPRVALTICAGLAAALPHAARAADLPRPAPVYTKAPITAVARVRDWTGFYVGVHAGYGKVDPTAYVDPAALGQAVAAASGNPAVVVAGATPAFALSVFPKGAFGGVQTGYNWQNGQFVYGVEADLSLAQMSGSAAGSYLVLMTIAGDGFRFAGTAQLDQKIDMIGSLRGRIGWAGFGDLLLYGTGGLAFAHVKTSISTNNYVVLAASSFPPGYPAALNGAASVSEMQWGYALGGGGEWAFAPNWSAKAEYLYYDLKGGSNLAILGMTASSTGITMHTVRVGLNYKLN